MTGETILAGHAAETAQAAPAERRPRLATLALAALAAHLGAASAQEGDGRAADEARYLAAQWEAAGCARAPWHERLAAALHAPQRADEPLLYAAQQVGLSVVEALAAALAAAVEEEPLAGRAVAYAQAPLGGSRPTLGLLATVLAPWFGDGEDGPDRPARLGAALAGGAALRSGLLALLHEGAPLTERALAMPAPIALALRGVDGGWPGVTVGVDARVNLPPSVAAAAARHAHALAGMDGALLTIRTRSAGEGRSVAALLAQEMGLRPAFFVAEPPPGAGVWLLLRGLLPVFVCDLGPGERKAIHPIPGYGGPLLAVCGPEGAVEAEGRAALNWTIPAPSAAERQRLWLAALGDGAAGEEVSALAADLALHHRHGSGRIAQLGALARHQARVREEQERRHNGAGGAAIPTLEDVRAAAWSGEGGGLDALAQPLPDAVPDGALVLSAGLRRELELLLARCRARDGLVEGLGVAAAVRYRPGVRALLVGPSGTGKTLAAGWLATRLGLPLYRVDLAAVTSKYIGETEKNLAQLLARAEQHEAVLLFDEADSLFGKRTDVQQANDRFANAQTNYLLQRMESYEGIAVLTSNSRSRFDDGFTRRLDAIVEFGMPGPQERRSLWLAHLGSGASAPGVSAPEINRLAAAADLAGGHIRNAVLSAAVMAQAEGRPIAYADLIEGMKAEYRKLGKQAPAELRA